MAASFKRCGVCDIRHINKLSLVWCTECDERLCTDCQKHHSLFKSISIYNTIVIWEYHRLPDEVPWIIQYCSTHQEQFLMYWRNHECACCRKCIVERDKKCQDIENEYDVIKNFQTSYSLLFRLRD